MAKNDLQGTLDLLVLKTLAQMGALHRMKQSGWIASQWAHTVTNRKAKYYKLRHRG